MAKSKINKETSRLSIGGIAESAERENARLYIQVVAENPSYAGILRERFLNNGIDARNYIEGVKSNALSGSAMYEFLSIKEKKRCDEKNGYTPVYYKDHKGGPSREDCGKRVKGGLSRRKGVGSR